jgi:hypothetical protein
MVIPWLVGPLVALVAPGITRFDDMTIVVYRVTSRVVVFGLSHWFDVGAAIGVVVSVVGLAAISLGRAEEHGR